jgi:hypothetical protein
VKKKRFSVEQITAVLQQAEQGVPVAVLSLDKVIVEDVVQKSSEAGEAARGRALLQRPI